MQYGISTVMLDGNTAKCLEHINVCQQALAFELELSVWPDLTGVFSRLNTFPTFTNIKRFRYLIGIDRMLEVKGCEGGQGGTRVDFGVADTTSSAL